MTQFVQQDTCVTGGVAQIPIPRIAEAGRDVPDRDRRERMVRGPWSCDSYARVNFPKLDVAVPLKSPQNTPRRLRLVGSRRSISKKSRNNRDA
jgi:hypothetical protein